MSNLDPAVARVTDRIIARSRDGRQRYLDLMEREADRHGGREAMVWREDCVDCAVAVLTQDGHENKAYGITGPNLENFAEIAAMLSEVSGREVVVEETDDAGMFAHFDALGIPRHPVDDQTVANIPYCSTDMVSFERTIREGFAEIRTDDVELLTGRKPRSVREMIDRNAEFLRSVVTGTQ